MNILKILTLSGVASTLALSNSQFKVEDCPECKNIELISETSLTAEENQNSDIQLTDNQDETSIEQEDTDENNEVENVDPKYTYEDYYACYENVKSKLTEILELNQEYAQKCDNCNDLNDEDKEKLKTNFQEIETLIETLEDNNDKILCNITGECDEIEDDLILMLRQLERRVDIIQNAMRMAQNFAFYQNPHSNIYGYYYRYYPKQNGTENDEEIATQNDSTENNKKGNIDTFNPVKRTSNIDTYGPDRRNIDTFFNTALIDDNIFDYNGENYMGNYGMGYMGNPYMFGGRVNGHNGSNGGYKNPNFSSEPNGYNTKNNLAEQNISNKHNAKIDGERDGLDEPKKFKFGKNIDTYMDETMHGNINTMGGKKVTDYVKDVFNKYFKKDKSEKNNNGQNNDEFDNQTKRISQNEINNYVDNFIDNHQTDNKEKSDSNIGEKNLKGEFIKEELPLLYK